MATDAEIIDWAQVETALEVQADTGQRSPILAIACRANSGRYQEISARVMAPRHEALAARRRELQAQADERRRETEARAMEAAARQTEAIERLVDSRLAELGVAPKE